MGSQGPVPHMLRPPPPSAGSSVTSARSPAAPCGLPLQPGSTDGRLGLSPRTPTLASGAAPPRWLKGPVQRREHLVTQEVPGVYLATPSLPMLPLSCAVPLPPATWPSGQLLPAELQGPARLHGDLQEVPAPEEKAGHRSPKVPASAVCLASTCSQGAQPGRGMEMAVMPPRDRTEQGPAVGMQEGRGSQSRWPGAPRLTW